MAVLTRRSLGIAAGMLTAVALTAGALISFSSSTSRRAEPDMSEIEDVEPQPPAIEIQDPGQQ